MKKILALLLAVTMSVCMFSACELRGKNSVAEKSKVVKFDAEKEKAAAKKTVADYLDLLFSGDERALDYLKEDSLEYKDAKEGIKQLNSLSSAFENIDEIPAEYRDEMTKILKGFTDASFSLLDYEIIDAKVENEEEITVKLVLYSPDFSKTEAFINSIDPYTIMLEIFSDEEILEIAAAQSEEEVFGLMLRLYDTLFDKVVEELETTVQEETIEYKLEKEGENWVIAY